MAHQVTSAARRRWRLLCPNYAQKWSVFALAEPGSRGFATRLNAKPLNLSQHFWVKQPLYDAEQHLCIYVFCDYLYVGDL